MAGRTSHTRARFLIVGCGYLGAAVGVRLAAMGHGVWGLARDPSKLPVNVNPVEGDVTIPNTFRRIPDVDVVLYLVRPRSEEPETLRGTLTTGPARLLEAFRAKRIRLSRFVFGSSIEVYGDRDGEWVDEDSSLGEAAVSKAAEALLAGERALLEAMVPSTVLRLGELYGPDRPGLAAAFRDRAPPVPAPLAHTNLIHRHDAVEATVHLATAKRPEKLYLLCDREPARRLDVLDWLAERQGKEIPPVDGSAKPDSNVRAMSERLVESGFHFRYPTYREGYRALIG